MITMQDVDAAIAECQGARHLSAKGIELLAALYTIKDHMEEPQQGDGYSYASGSSSREIVRYMGQSPFARAIYGRDARDVWLLMDDLMSAVKTTAPRLYDSVMRQL